MAQSGFDLSSSLGLVPSIRAQQGLLRLLSQWGCRGPVSPVEAGPVVGPRLCSLLHKLTSPECAPDAARRTLAVGSARGVDVRQQGGSQHVRSAASAGTPS